MVFSGGQSEILCNGSAVVTYATIDLFSLRKLVPQLWFGCLVVSA